MDRAELHSPPSSALSLQNQTHFLLQLWITNTDMHFNSLLFGVEKVQVDMNVCGVLCVMWLFSAVTLFNERKMEAFKKMAAALLKGSMGDLMQSKSVCARAHVKVWQSSLFGPKDEAKCHCRKLLPLHLPVFLLGSHCHIPSILCAVTYTQQSPLAVT